MDFTLSVDHEILRDSVRKFAEKEIKSVARELDKKEELANENVENTENERMIVGETESSEN